MHFYCAGAGGVGMSYVERYLAANGHKVTGVDSVESTVTRRLRDSGITVHIGHKIEYLADDVDMVLASPAVLIANPPDIVEARARGIAVRSWQEYLGDITRAHKTVSICGTHGKSTTTAMLGQAMQTLKLDPTVMVGTMVEAFGGDNLRIGDSDWLILESDEFYENFLSYDPTHVLCTSMEPDHLDFFETEERYYQAYEKFFMKLPEDGKIFYHAKDLAAERAIARVGASGIPVEMNSDVQLTIPGAHNRENAALVVAFLEYIGIQRQHAIDALQEFKGTWRRQELIGKSDIGDVIYDDYAHHPTEIRATLAALREKYPNAEIVALFQPHQFSRTKSFLEEFSYAFEDADLTYIMDIYASRDTEEDKASVASQDIIDRIASQEKHVDYAGSLERAEHLLKSLPETVKERVIVCMGAGTVTQVAHSLIA